MRSARIHFCTRAIMKNLSMCDYLLDIFIVMDKYE